MGNRSGTGRLSALVLALVLGLSLAVPAAAANAGFRITIIPNIHVSTPNDIGVRDTDDEGPVRTRFWAYQIFDGDITEGDEIAGRPGNPPSGNIVTPDPGQLKVTGWGTSVANKAELVKALTDIGDSALDMGVSYSMMRDADENFYEAEEKLKEYYEVYQNRTNWLDRIGGTLTKEGEDNLKLAFGNAVYGKDGTGEDALTLGELFGAALKHMNPSGNANNNEAAQAVAQVISDFTPYSGNAALAEVITGIVSARDSNGNYKYLNDSAHVESSWDTAGAWNIDLPAGYYLIQDHFKEGAKYENKANSEYVISVFGNNTVYAKADAPSADKFIVGAGKAGGFEIADAFTFQLKGTLPENYNTAYGGPSGGYVYSFHDTMDNGLDFGGIRRVYVKVYDAGGAYGPDAGDTRKYNLYVVSEGDGEAGHGYTVTVTAGQNSHTLTLDLGNLKTLVGRKAAKITAEPWTTESTAVPIPIASSTEIYAEYTAALNENTRIHDRNGSWNTAELHYSNDPNWPEEDIARAVRAVRTDWSQSPTGRTSQVTTRAFDFGVQIQKVGDADDDEEGEPALAGAAFALKKSEPGHPENILYAILHRIETQPEGAEGDGETPAEYTYFPVRWVTQADVKSYTGAVGGEEAWYSELDGALGGVTYSAGDGYYLSVMTQSDGRLRVEGLNSEIPYYLEEVVTPQGYITGDDVIVTFHAGYESNVLKTLTAEVYDGFETYVEPIVDESEFSGYDERVVHFKVINIPADGYPVKTGGIGTAPFYAGGGALLAGAALLLIFSKVKKKKETHTGP